MQTAMEAMTDKLNAMKNELSVQLRTKDDRIQYLESQQTKQSKRFEELKQELQGALEAVH